MPDHVIVYHSRSEEAMDRWLWDEGGAQVVAGGLAIGLLVLIVIGWWQSRPYRNLPRFRG